MDNLPLALIEALSYGRPILAAPVGGIPEIFRDGVEGYYCDLDDPNEGAAKLTQLLQTSTLGTISRAARARFEATFAESTIGARFAHFLLDDADG
jgi:glycosyltransferase involved in cell wall biosynthesis